MDLILVVVDLMLVVVDLMLVVVDLMLVVVDLVVVDYIASNNKDFFIRLSLQKHGRPCRMLY
jgi:hypothetical protein